MLALERSAKSGLTKKPPPNGLRRPHPHEDRRVGARLADRRAAHVQNVEAQGLKSENARLQALVFELRTASPSVARLADLAVWREREAFEEKTRRALVLLRKKDNKIRELGDALARRRNVGAAERGLATVGRQGDQDAGSVGASGVCGGRGTSGSPARSRSVKNCHVGIQSDDTRKLEEYIREQAEQIQALLEEVARLRAAETPMAQRSNVHTPTESSAGKQWPGDHQKTVQQVGAGRTGEDPAPADAAITDELHAQVVELKSALSAQATALAEKEAALHKALESRRREREKAHQREEVLSARVSTLERLQEAARRTVLDREERLRQKEPMLRSRGRDHNTNGGSGGDNQEKDVVPAAVDGIVDLHDTSAQNAEGKIRKPTEQKQSTPTVKDLQEFYGAQDWWLHLSRAARSEADGSSGEREASVVTGEENNGDVDRKYSMRKLRQLLHDQALEVVALRQRALKAEMVTRIHAREEQERAADMRRRVATLELALRTQKTTDTTRMAELDAHVTALSARGHTHEVLAAAREEAIAGKLALIRAEGDACLHLQLLEDEKQRSTAALTRAEDLQGHMDRVSVMETLRNLPGGVSASTLIDHFAGAASRQSQRIETLESEVRNLRIRSARLARLARGENAETFSTPTTGDMDATAARAEERERREQASDGEWVEAAVEEAAVAMAAERRRALEQEVESLRHELLTQRQRANNLERENRDERHRRSTSESAAGIGKREEDVDILRRELNRSSSEIEALRVHVVDLRTSVRSADWSWQGRNLCSGHCRCGGRSEGTIGAALYPDARSVSHANMLLKEIAADLDGGDSVECSSAEVSRLESLLAEKDAQMSVLSATIDALHLPPTSPGSSPKRNGGIPNDAGARSRGRSLSPLRRQARGNKPVSTSSLCASWNDAPGDVDGGVGVLKHISAQGLMRHCVALATRLTSTMSRAWASERRADRVAVELERKERGMRATEAKLGGLTERNRALGIECSKAAVALKALHAETSLRLREAGDEASKLRSALRDAEVGADDAKKRLQSARTENQALEAELRRTRDRHRDEINRLSDGHMMRLKELADRLSVDGSISPLERNSFVSGVGTVAHLSMATSSPIAVVLAEQLQKWRALVADEYTACRHKQHSPTMRADRRLLLSRVYEHDTISGVGNDRQKVVATFLRETATRLEEMCSRAARRARTMEWELRDARQEALDSSTALEEARVERARLSARAEAAEAVVISMGGAANSLPFSPSGGGSGGVCNLNAPPMGTSGGTRDGAFGAWRGSCTAAAVSLLEKRLDAAMEDIATARTARAAAEAGEMAAVSQAEAAEAKGTGIRAAADVHEADMERHKGLVSDELRAEASAWRREIRAELGRWWQDDLVHLHHGIALDWGRSAAADETIAACTSPSKVGTGTTLPSRRANNRTSRQNAADVGVSGEEAMAQALISGRVDQAILEERLLAREQHLACARGEALRLRSVLERWQNEFVAPAVEAKRRRSAATALAKTQPVSTGTAGSDRLERLLLAATADLLGARDETAGLRAEVAALHALVANLQQDEAEARGNADRRVASARQTIQRRSEGDLRDASERLAEERERFKTQLGIAHADILRLGAAVAELEQRNQQHELARSRNGKDKGMSGDSLRSSGSKSGFLRPDGEFTGSNQLSETRIGREEKAGEEERKRQLAGEGVDSGTERERTVRVAAEEEREDLQRMCKRLALDLHAAEDAKAEAEDENQALVQEAAKAKVEAQMASLARESQEGALKEVVHVLELVRENSTVSDRRQGEGPRQPAALLSGWNRSQEEARRFARIVVAAKVAEADLLRRLEAAAAHEAELRHMLRRRDRRIEELKREQISTDDLTRPGRVASVLTRSALAGGHGTDAQNGGPGLTGPFVGGGGDDTELGQTRSKAIRAERAEKTVSHAALVLRLELELAEAGARGEVGDASTRAASHLAFQLLPASKGLKCELCDRALRAREGPKVHSAVERLQESQRRRGESFLMPTTELECKAAAWESSAHVQKRPPVAKAAKVYSAETVGIENVGDKGRSRLPTSEVRVASDQALMVEELGRLQTPSPSCGEAGTSREGLPQPHFGLSHGVRSLEAQLSRLALDVGASDEFLRGTDATTEGLVGDGGRSESRSPASRLPGAAKAPWVQTVLDLKEQVANLRHRAAYMEQLLNEDCMEKQALEEEVLRLRTEIIIQERSHRQATAAPEERYESEQLAGSRQRKVGEGNASCRARGDEGSLVTGAVRGREFNAGRSSADSPDTTGDTLERGKASSMQSVAPRKVSSGVAVPAETEVPSHVELQMQSLRASLKRSTERLAEKESELREARTLHIHETEQAREELDQLVQTQRVRVTKLEEQVRCVRRKMKALAPRSTRWHQRYGRAIGKGGLTVAAANRSSTSSPWAADELLGMLAVADEENFEAKARAQRAEYELLARSSETNALRRSVVTNGNISGLKNAVAVFEGEEVPRDRGDPADGGANSLSALNRVGSLHIGTSELAAIICAARVAAAETEVKRLGDECIAVSASALVAHRDAAALRRAASKASDVRNEDGRAREKELKNQISALKREADRLRGAAGGALFPRSGAERSHRSEATPEALAAVNAALSKSRAQLTTARENADRRGRTIIALRAAKASIEKQLRRRDEEIAAMEAKLDRAIKDAGVKGNAVQALRDKIAVLQAELNTAQSSETFRAAAVTGLDSVAKESVVQASVMLNAATETHADGQERSHEQRAQVGDDCREEAMRELRAERDRMRASMRARQGLLSKKTAECDARVAEVKRLEEQARALRAAVERKDDALRTTKKQLMAVREEYESLKVFSDRWQADAEIKWRNLKRSSESAKTEATLCRQSGDAAARELVALKSAFRSFLKTLWDDLRSRPAALVQGATAKDKTECLNFISCSGTAKIRPCAEKNTSGCLTRPGVSADTTTMARAGKTDQIGSFDRDVVCASYGAIAPTSPLVERWCGRGERRPVLFAETFGELTEAEVSDIMHSLSADSLRSSSMSSFIPAATSNVLVTAEEGNTQPRIRGPNGVSRGPSPASQEAVDPRVEREDDNERFLPAKVESALGAPDTSEALANVLCSMRSSGFSQRSSLEWTRSGQPLSDQPPPPPPQTAITASPVDPKEEGRASKTTEIHVDTLSGWSSFPLKGGVSGTEPGQEVDSRFSGDTDSRFGSHGGETNDSTGVVT